MPPRILVLQSADSIMTVFPQCTGGGPVPSIGYATTAFDLDNGVQNLRDATEDALLSETRTCARSTLTSASFFVLCVLVGLLVLHRSAPPNLNAGISLYAHAVAGPALSAHGTAPGYRPVPSQASRRTHAARGTVPQRRPGTRAIGAAAAAEAFGGAGHTVAVARAQYPVHSFLMDPEQALETPAALGSWPALALIALGAAMHTMWRWARQPVPTEASAEAHALEGPKVSAAVCALCPGALGMGTSSGKVAGLGVRGHLHIRSFVSPR